MLKVFLVDLSELGGIARVIGFLVVGALLVGVSYLYQRSRGGGGVRATPAESSAAGGAAASGLDGPAR